MKLSTIDTLDTELLGDAGVTILFKTSDEIDRWIPALARQLEVSDTELQEMLDQLRIFFVLVIVAMKSRKLFPNKNRVPTEPPPSLKRLWTAMYADKKNYYKFLEVLDLNRERELQFQEKYLPERSITVENALILRVEVAEKIHLPINEKYWQFPKLEAKRRYLDSKICPNDYGGTRVVVYFAEGQPDCFYDLKDLPRLRKMIDEDSIGKFWKDFIDLVEKDKLGDLRSPPSS